MIQYRKIANPSQESLAVSKIHALASACQILGLEPSSIVRMDLIHRLPM